MLNKSIKDFLYIDIETVSKYKTFSEFYISEPRMCDLWLKKSDKFKSDKKYQEDMFYTPDNKVTNIDNAIYFDKASIYPEFGKIIAITLGFFDENMNKRIKILSNENELELLKEFKELIENKNFEKKILFGHNIGSFDVPYIAKKFVFNGYRIPKKINTVGLKPWELGNVLYDTMDVFKMGSFEILSFDLLTACLGVDSPKQGIDGSQVNSVYWYEENGIERIKEYNKNDVNALMEVAIKMDGLVDLM